MLKSWDERDKHPLSIMGILKLKDSITGKITAFTPFFEGVLCSGSA